MDISRQIILISVIILILPLTIMAQSSKCGDSVCDSDENPRVCAWDCAAICGDYYCSEGENETCMDDCMTTCGDGKCIFGLENSTSCQQDCYDFNLYDSSLCSNENCDWQLGENTNNCAKDCMNVNYVMCDPFDKSRSPCFWKTPTAPIFGLGVAALFAFIWLYNSEGRRKFR